MVTGYEALLLLITLWEKCEGPLCYMESEKLHIDVADLTWEIFKERFREKFLSPQYREACTDEFHELKH